MVARWEIDAKNVHKAIVDDEFAQGIQLRLPWTDQMPEHSKLRLDVRYTTPDGRHLDARADVHITLPGQFSARWTPRAPRSPNDETGSPSGRQAPVNIAQQPKENESAKRSHAPAVIQSAFTTVAEAEEDGAGSATSATKTKPTAPESPTRPAWRPTR
jgi:hypothetical protein